MNEKSTTNSCQNGRITSFTQMGQMEQHPTIEYKKTIPGATP
jgi:hypothetical protein